ncbi:hypothetical protein N9C85_01590 [Synechococcus sp. AH-224-I15]|nr:hypothetical protein [Synechococcus sp. AH-224-I15]
MSNPVFTQDSLRDELAPIPQLAAGPDEWFPLGVSQLGTILKALKAQNLSTKSLVGFVNFVDAATDAMAEEDKNLDKVLLLRRKGGKIEQLMLPRVGRSKTDKDAIALQIGDTYVPVTQDGQKFTAGGLANEDLLCVVFDEEGREGNEEDSPRRYRHRLTLTDEESGETYEVVLLTDNAQDCSASAIKSHLKKGNNFAELLAVPSSGGGGGLCMPMLDYVTQNGLEFPVELKVVGLRKIPSRQEWRKAKGGIAWGLLIEGGGGIYARGGSESYLDRNCDAAEGLLKQMGHMVLQITGTSVTSRGNTVVENQLLLPADSFADLDGLLLSGAAPQTKAVAPAKKAAADEAPANNVKKAAVSKKEPVAAGDTGKRTKLLADLDL